MSSNIFFPVCERPLINPLTHSASDNYKCIMREDTNEVLSVMTNEYKLIPNEEIASLIMTESEKYGKVIETYENFSDRRFMLKYTFTDWKIGIDVLGDAFNPQIVIRNSYDGTIQLSVLVGAFRLVCSNGLIIGDKYFDFKNRHNRNNPRIDDVPAIFHKAVNSLESQIGNLNILKTPFLKENLPRVYKFLPEPYDKDLTEYVISNPIETHYDLLNSLTYIATHKMNRDYESTHKLEMMIYPFVNSFLN